MSERYAVVLAAGKGTRMKSKLYKVLHPICGKPMVTHVIDALQPINMNEIITVVGHGAEEVQTVLEDRSQFVLQEEQLGTAHAVMQVREQLEGKSGVTLVICGDTPLLTNDTITKLFEKHEATGAKATVLTARTTAPDGYGRVIRNEQNIVERIVEHKDATEEERLVQEINTGTYCFDNQALFETLTHVDNENSQQEYYLPDCIHLMQARGWTVAAYEAEHFHETIGVNDRVALAAAEKVMRKRILEHHMRQGVTIVDPDNTYVEASVTIGRDTVLLPGTTLQGQTTIGEDCTVGPHTELKDATVGNGSTIKQSVVYDSEVGDHVEIGPYAHLRGKAFIGDACRIGNFVEVKKTTFGQGSKAAHLSYLGDAVIGKDVNVGCGSITVNYDGNKKHQTHIDDGAFIGCNTNLVAPVKVGEKALVAAGSTITENVPAHALSIARSRQVNKEGYTETKKQD
ncbi:bifunctional UDP-N-acetylglucosamine diphosphorylase/glucosamine-1-phosphate N-acetyltransferase GlmU [Bacillaceae bacterium SIJ1]|uniref:bifunctional UDP-N-acetylglucosamine diphosphorylase/glucosamine-1-phosphate N-acetyltransferase GlmU n=1 Tax=Litoribacterium kuwaitense TaxID=1398745 RepID=UPI0013EC1245|nr:bifunctional UDP-N-acetylglucosamine diphosphorylase/glucosamine-1-phosphate N-acetyltransferase GlmU [Litoribacterium kuwaitense]NGP45800.1 bifunctional UDP-N-acetylglucosamine diphosphorylase/glucosamine-1-phosphate N-acetyltransferase GlmU [Litoribacterium kuwaitense]